MSEQLGVVAQPVWTQKDIKRILNELTEERRHSYELADKLKAVQVFRETFAGEVWKFLDTVVANSEDAVWYDRETTVHEAYLDLLVRVGVPGEVVARLGLELEDVQ